MRIIIFFTILLIIQSCKSQRELQYRKASSSDNIEYLENYIRKYPNDENIDEIKYRLRVLEYEKIKKSNDLMLLNYFVAKYKKGRDTDKIREKIFNIKIKKYENDKKYLTYLKSEFNEEKYLKTINKKIQSNDEKELQSLKTVKNEEDKEKIVDFLNKYPHSKLVSYLDKLLKDYKLKKLISSKNIREINDFLKKNPEYKTKEIENRLSSIALKKYENAPLEILEKFLKNNDEKTKNHKKIENIYKERAYLKYTSFYDYENLMKLDEKYHYEKYKKQVEYFKKNEDKIKKINKLIKSFYIPLKYRKNIENQIYLIARNTKEESEFIIKSSFFTNDPEAILKKVSSHFLIIKLSVFKALEYYYNSDTENRKKEFYDIIKKLEKYKKSYHKEKILMLSLVLNDENLFSKYLNELIIENDYDIWLNFLRFNFFDIGDYSFIDLLYGVTEIEIKGIHSDNTLEVNKFNKKINLALIKKFLEFAVKTIKIKEEITNSKIIREIKILRKYLSEIDDFNFKFIEEYETTALKNLKKLQTIIKINPYLRNHIIKHSPIVKLKYLLGKKCNIWCLKKKNIYSVFF